MVVMDSRLKAFCNTINGISFDGVSVADNNFVDLFDLQLSSQDHNNFYVPSPNTVLLPSSSSTQEYSPEDCDFSDAALKYISKMLMEEDMEEKSCMHQESAACLQAAEKPFFDILDEQNQYHPPPPDPHPDQLYESPVDAVNVYEPNYNSSSSSSSTGNTVENNWVLDLPEFQFPNLSTDYLIQPTSQSSLSPSSIENDINHFIDGLIDPQADIFNVTDFYSESQPVWNFIRGFEEANKFLPKSSNLFIDLESNEFLNMEPKKQVPGRVVVKEEKKDDREYSPNGKGKKNLHPDDVGFEEGRSNKHSAVSSEEPLREEMDRVLLCGPMKNESFQTEESNSVQRKGHSKVSKGGKSRRKKQGGKRDVVDLRTLLIHCAQAVAADDRRTANELLKQIRQHSSAYGDGTQRLAHYFADGLEARLTGTGSQICSTILTKMASAADILKAYQLYLTACPFKKLSHFVANKTIFNLAQNATRVHIVDFGIFYGFQWPCLLQKLAARPGGPPKLRITGIDLPQPGFRPAERVEETGRRLADYAKSFNVPFEYHAIAQKWETIQLEDIKIDPDELLIVNSMYRFRNLLDETVELASPRNAVLRLIRKMNPAIFVQGILNGTHSAPFFVTRFREALFFYSSLFDLFDTNVPREHPERILLERDIFGRQALNVIACEGSARVERPETYKQWQVRNMRAGFEPFPLNKEILKKAWDWVKSSYHKDFVVDQDGHWLLHGWKGRIMYAISVWRPSHES